MRKFIGTSLLVLVLSCAAHAGDMPFGITDPPQPPPTTTPSTNGDMPFGRQGAATEAVLNVLGSVLSLF